MTEFLRDLFKYIFRFLTHRLFIIMVVFSLLYIVLFARLFELQIINGSKLEEEFALRVLREIEIEGQRGLIYDRNGKPLAVNEIAYTLMYDNSVFTEDKNELLLRIIRILDSNQDELSIDFPIILNQDMEYEFFSSTSRLNTFITDIFGKKADEEKMKISAEGMMEYLVNDFFSISEKEILEKQITKEELLKLVSLRHALWSVGYYKYIPQEIAKNISMESLAELKENKDLLPGTSIIEDPVRRYLYPEYTSHILGYTGKISTDVLPEYEPYGYDQNDVVGRIGIEEYMELYLHSQDGVQTVEIDNLGRTMNVIETKEAVAGKDVYLTIDLDLQIQTQNLLVKQLCNLISQKLVLKKPTFGETRLPLLKDAFYNMVDNNTIHVEELLSSQEGSYSYKVMEEFDVYYQDKILELAESLEASEPKDNETLERYYDYILEALTKDRILDSTHINSSGYSDYSKGNISFTGLLSYYIKDKYISIDRYLDLKNVTFQAGTDDEIAAYLIDQIILNNYTHQYDFKKTIIMEMLDQEEFAYINLCMVLVEQNIIFIDQETIEKLETKRLSPLDFMKKIILEVKLTPQQLALDPSTGAIVVTDVHTGDVLALVSYPSYDNNRISDYAYYQSQLEDPTKPLYPTATQGKTAPGSTFKMLSTVAGLEEGVITPQSYVTCVGEFTKISPPVACLGRHGSINVLTALAVSCNTFFNEVGYRLGINEEGTYSPRLGIDKLIKYATMFGLNTTTGIELIESKPSMPGGVDNAIVNPATAAMGQEYNSYTPTQIARYVATLANGGTLYKMTLIDRVYHSDGSLYYEKEPEVELQSTFKEGSLETARQGMIEVTSGARGTARSLFADYPVLIGGKTGTAQENRNRASHAIFTAFAPGDAPEIAVASVIPYSYTSPFSSGYIVGTVTRDVIGVYYNIFGQSTPYHYDSNFILD